MTDVKELIEKLAASKLVRFGAVGGAGAVVNFAAFAFAKELLHLGKSGDWAFAFAVAVTFTWWGNRTITFHEHKSDSYKGMLVEWAKFVAANSIGAAANFAVYWPLTHLAPWPLSNEYAANGLGILIGLIFNYTLSKRLVFRRKNVTPPPAPP